VSRLTDMREVAPRRSSLIMAASAAMIVAGVCVPVARAQDAVSATSIVAPASNNLVLLNQIQSLRDQMQQMQGQIEVLQHQLQKLQQSGKDQYSDLDARIGKLEHPAPTSAPDSSAPPSSVAAASAPATSSGQSMSADDTAKAQADFDAAFKSLRAGNYVDSARGFRAFIDKYPGSPLVSNAYYWLGGSYYVTQNYKPALAAFQALLQKYPDSPKAAEAQLRVADCEIGMKDYPAARATLQTVIKAHPGTSLEKRARQRMQDIPAPSGTR
jgi:tol-pal system protein YbgF